MALFSIPPLSLSLLPQPNLGFISLRLTKPQHLHMHWYWLHKSNTLCISRCVPRVTQNPNAFGNNTDQKPPWMSQIILFLHRLRDFLKYKFILAAQWIREKMNSPKDIALLVLGIFLMLSRVRTSCQTLKEVPYSQLVNGINLGHVSSVDFEEGSRCIYFDIISNEQAKEEHASSITKRYRTRKMDRDEKFLLGLLREKGVTYRSVPPPVSRLLVSCIGTIAGVWIGIIPVIWLLERRLHGNNRKKTRTCTRQMVSFDDVQGVDSAKEELIEVVNCLQGTLDYKKLGAKLPTGVLLVGPPGTGKTLLARAVAGEAGVPFFSVSASEFVEMYVGRGAARVRDLFKEARREAPAVVFIDELDAVGTERDGFSHERDQTLNQLLTEMDGFDSDKQVIVLAATNRAAALDPALLRPGRFSRKVFVGEPDLEGRKRIMAVHLRGVPLEEETEMVCDLVASLTKGFVGADLANIANEAALLAVRRGGRIVTREDIMEAIEREKVGINENKANSISGSKCLEKLFPWLPSLAQGSVKFKNRDRNAIGSRRVLSN